MNYRFIDSNRNVKVKPVLCLILLMISSGIEAVSINEVRVKSEANKKVIPVSVFLPDSYDSFTYKRFPVVYLLHGYSGTWQTFVTGYDRAEDIIDSLDIIVVCPDGGYDSYYLDSPVDLSSNYETFIVKELVSYIDSAYRTIPKRRKRGITGLSMGGHGSMFLALRNQSIFGVTGSMSGTVDFRASMKPEAVTRVLGDKISFAENWSNYSARGLIENSIKRVKVMIFTDCGTGDPYLEVNREFSQLLSDRKIKHEYREYPGGHNSDYWRKALPEQLMFMSSYFRKVKAKDKR